MSLILEKTKNYYRREIRLELPPGSNFFYRSYSNMSMPLDPSPAYECDGFNVEFTSADVIITGHAGLNKYVLAGAVTAFRSMSYFILGRRGSNVKFIEVRQPDIMEGETPEEVIILEGNDWHQLLKDYAAVCKQKNHVPDFDTAKNLTGYCTWYYYYADVTEKDFLENLDAMAAHRESCYSADVIQIDDGYQTFQGDWNDQDSSWPTPLPDICKRITGAGMKAGIWLMPFQASTASRVFREHPDWFVKDENGQPKVAKGWSPPPDDMWACLDTTIPAVQDHLANVFKTFQSWGFTYFKMDGLGFGLTEGKRSDPDATPVSAFRQGLQAIRNAVPDAHLLGCCPPFLPCLGLVDSARISQDTHASWPTIRDCFLSVASRYWMYDTFFRCDPDTLMARQDKARHTIEEARVSVLSGIITGVSLTSDNLNTIDPERLELLGRGAKIRMRDVTLTGYCAHGLPCWLSGTVDGKKAVAIANVTDNYQEFRFEDIGLDPAKDAEEILQPLGARKYMVTVKPHDAMLLVQE